MLLFLAVVLKHYGNALQLSKMDWESKEAIFWVWWKKLKRSYKRKREFRHIAITTNILWQILLARRSILKLADECDDL
ncbi:unnamed protein product [Coffea canephora]|uniref:DH200=94 genomic scaffold, scaffold_203 n=1 Tax=Coffea canephora TaxID=49390 RepID=A0A068VBG3_COFCA|nr:unnamed protein product [Coffea canephora]